MLAEDKSTAWVIVFVMIGHSERQANSLFYDWIKWHGFVIKMLWTTVLLTGRKIIWFDDIHIR